jgi:hypothetical protein
MRSAGPINCRSYKTQDTSAHTKDAPSQQAQDNRASSPNVLTVASKAKDKGLKGQPYSLEELSRDTESLSVVSGGYSKDTIMETLSNSMRDISLKRTSFMHQPQRISPQSIKHKSQTSSLNSGKGMLVTNSDSLGSLFLSHEPIIPTLKFSQPTSFLAGSTRSWRSGIAGPMLEPLDTVVHVMNTAKVRIRMID